MLPSSPQESLWPLDPCCPVPCGWARRGPRWPRPSAGSSLDPRGYNALMMLRFPWARPCSSSLVWPQPPAPGKFSESFESQPRCHFSLPTRALPQRCHVVTRGRRHNPLQNAPPHRAHALPGVGARCVCPHLPPATRGSWSQRRSRQGCQSLREVNDLSGRRGATRPLSF